MPIIHIYIKMIGTLKNNKGIASQLMILDTKGIKYVKKLYESVYIKRIKLNYQRIVQIYIILFFDIYDIFFYKIQQFVVIFTKESCNAVNAT